MSMGTEISLSIYYKNNGNIRGSWIVNGFVSVECELWV